MGYDLKNYVTVAERMREFYKRYPEGSLQLDPVEFREIEGKTWVIGRAKAYRTPDDSRPGVGTAWEIIPGLTNFTKYSEVQNVETSAWGRALAAIGISIDRGVATWEEVQRAPKEDRPKAVPATVSGPLADRMATEPPSPKQTAYAKRLMGTAGEGAVEAIVEAIGEYSPPETWSKYETSRVIDALLELSRSKSGHHDRTDSTPTDDPWYAPEPPEDTG